MDNILDVIILVDVILSSICYLVQFASEIKKGFKAGDSFKEIIEKLNKTEIFLEIIKNLTEIASLLFKIN